MILSEKGFSRGAIASALGNAEGPSYNFGLENTHEYKEPVCEEAKRALNLLIDDYKDALYILSECNLPRGESMGDYKDAISALISINTTTLHVDSVLCEFYHLLEHRKIPECGDIQGAEVALLLDVLDIDYNSAIRYLTAYSLEGRSK